MNHKSWKIATFLLQQEGRDFHALDCPEAKRSHPQHAVCEETLRRGGTLRLAIVQSVLQFTFALAVNRDTIHRYGKS
jgi:hypothetical protein